MKKCDYCAKEISYNEMYCCEECENLTKEYYRRADRYAKPFSIINVICLFGVMAGMFVFSMANVFGAAISIISCAILSILLLVLPFPTESMIRKFKIKKAIQITRMVGIGMMVIGFMIAGLLVVFMR